LAPALYAVHAVLTGASMVLMDLLGVRLGFGFSAGFFDYLLNYPLATRPLWLLPIGLAYGGAYYTLFRWCIRRFSLPTPGREVQGAPAAAAAPGAGQAEALVAALGGAANLRSVDACTTRLRLTLADATRVREDELRKLGAHGVIRPAANALQVVMGPAADRIAGEIRGYLGRATGAAADPVADPALDAWLAALGGAGNLRRVESCAGRVRVEVADREKARLDGPLPGLRASVW